jgi:hypothetical protein
MTDDMMNLRGLLEKTPDADLLRDMISFAAQRLMELEVEGLTGATYGEKPRLNRTFCPRRNLAQNISLHFVHSTCAAMQPFIDSRPVETRRTRGKFGVP